MTHRTTIPRAIAVAMTPISNPDMLFASSNMGAGVTKFPRGMGVSVSCGLEYSDPNAADDS